MHNTNGQLKVSIVTILNFISTKPIKLLNRESMPKYGSQASDIDRKISSLNDETCRKSAKC